MNSNRIFLAAIFLTVLYWILRLYEPFLLTFVISALLSMATYRINIKLIHYTKNNTLAALLSTLLLSILFFVPIVYIITSIGGIVDDFNTSTIDKVINYVKTLNPTLPASLEFLQPHIDDAMRSFDIKSFSTQTLSYSAYIGKNSATFLKDMFLIVVFFFFTNLYGPTLVSYVKKATPMDDNEIDFVFSEVSNVMSVLFYSILVTAIFEGLLFAFIGMYYGYDGLLLGILYGFASLIPVVGGALMWVPLSAYALANDNITEAISIAVYSIVVISIIADTFIKPLIIKYINKLSRVPTQINELLIFLAILAGLSTFGFWGMILGPALTALFVALIKLYEILKSKNFL
ncbi:MAG: AI-2E family transporter [Sulfurospirillum sp.]|nr:AI-2E family transporter [Sulfurospirillum sp.]